MTTNKSQCTYYEGDPRDGAQPCGRPCKGKSSWCPEHHAKLHRPTQPYTLRATRNGRYGEGEPTSTVRGIDQWAKSFSVTHKQARAVVHEEHGGRHILERGGRRPVDNEE